MDIRTQLILRFGWQRGRIFNNSDSARIMNSVSALGVFESISMRTHPNPQDPSKVGPASICSMRRMLMYQTSRCVGAVGACTAGAAGRAWYCCGLQMLLQQRILCFKLRAADASLKLDTSAAHLAGPAAGFIQALRAWCTGLESAAGHCRWMWR